MKINYVENKNGKLFSFFRHDFKSDTDKEGNYIMIDGGFDYSRYSGKLKSGEIKDLIGDIREQFTWGQNYDKQMNRLPKTIYKKLKDLETNHIVGILIYFTEKAEEGDIMNNYWKILHLLFLEELNFRTKNK